VKRGNSLHSLVIFEER